MLQCRSYAVGFFLYGYWLVKVFLPVFYSHTQWCESVFNLSLSLARISCGKISKWYCQCEEKTKKIRSEEFIIRQQYAILVFSIIFSCCCCCCSHLVCRFFVNRFSGSFLVCMRAILQKCRPLQRTTIVISCRHFWFSLSAFNGNKSIRQRESTYYKPFKCFPLMLMLMCVVYQSIEWVFWFSFHVSLVMLQHF